MNARPTVKFWASRGALSCRSSVAGRHPLPAAECNGRGHPGLNRGSGWIRRRTRPGISRLAWIAFRSCSEL